MKDLSEISSEEILKNINEAFQGSQNGLFNTAIDFTLSGTTCVSVLISGNNLYCGNVGDSRAFLAKFREGDWFFVQLSNDHKPDNPKEQERIIEAGGRVQALNDDQGNVFGPARVWLKNEHRPGLAMSRSIGDHLASTVGVIPEPEFVQTKLTSEDKYIVIASDGVWEFLKNEDVINMIEPFYRKGDIDGAVDYVIRESRKIWEREDKSIDDITCIILFLNYETCG